MDDLAYGKRNKRGDWVPNEPAGTAPLFVFRRNRLNFLNGFHIISYLIIYSSLCRL